MTVSTTVPATVQIKRRHLVGVIVAVAALVAALTWALTALATDTRTAQTRTPNTAEATVKPAAPGVDRELVAAEARPITVADPYHGVGVMFCIDDKQPVTVADAYHGDGVAVCV